MVSLMSSCANRIGSFGYARIRPLAPALVFAMANVVAAQSADRDFAGLIDIGSSREMYLECRGTGSPTVVLISGKGNGAADWNEILDPADPIRTAPTDLLAIGQGKLFSSDLAVLPSVSRFTRVCAYDRPGTRLDGPDISTPVPQPHFADRAVEDLHELLAAAGEAGPYVLVAHGRLARHTRERFDASCQAGVSLICFWRGWCWRS